MSRLTVFLMTPSSTEILPSRSVGGWVKQAPPSCRDVRQVRREATEGIPASRHAARTLSRNFSTSSLRWMLTSDRAWADLSI